MTNKFNKSVYEYVNKRSQVFSLVAGHYVKNSTWKIFRTPQWHDTMEHLESLRFMLSHTAYDILCKTIAKKLQVRIGIETADLQIDYPFPENTDLNDCNHWFAVFSNQYTYGPYSCANTSAPVHMPMYNSVPSSMSAMTLGIPKQGTPWFSPNNPKYYATTGKPALKNPVYAKGIGDTLSAAIIEADLNVGLSQAHCEM